MNQIKIAEEVFGVKAKEIGELQRAVLKRFPRGWIVVKVTLNKNNQIDAEILLKRKQHSPTSYSLLK